MSIHNMPFSISLPFIYPNLQLWEFSQGTQERVRNRRSTLAISVRAIEVLLEIAVRGLRRLARCRGSQAHTRISVS